MRLNRFPKIMSKGFTLTRLTVLLSLILIVGLVVGTPARMQESPGTTESDLVALNNEPYIPGQVIVQLNAGYDIATVAGMYGLDPVPIGQLTVGVPPVTSYLLRIIDSSTVEQKVATLTADITRIAFADANYYGGAPEAARPSWSVGDSYAGVMAGRKAISSQWARGKMRLDEAQQMTRGATSQGQPVIVAVLDTGIDLSHPAFAGRLVPASDMYDFVDNDSDPSEEGSATTGPYGHGTHVAGLIAMVAPDAKIMPIRVLGPDGRGDFFKLSQAIKFALDHGANVINLSLSTPNPSKLISDVFYHELDGPEDPPSGTYMPGTVVVAAAGNSGTVIREYPAAVDADPNKVVRRGRCVLSVAASTNDDGLAVFSTRGTWVSLMAPGERIISPVPYNHYGMWAGTSMASPLVAGEVALVRAMNPTASSRDVVTHIKTYSTVISGQQQRRIDAANAVTNMVPPHNRASQRSSKR
jgi:subtilisin family serine protease